MPNKPADWQIRAYQKEDAGELCRIYLDVRKSTFHWLDTSGYTINDFDRDTKGEVIRVAVLNEKPIGFIAWWVPDNFIHHLYIDTSFTNQGVGKALLKECLAEIGRPATLKCLQRNVQAFNFYRSQGWTVTLAVSATEGDYFLLTFSD
ncbi:GNAT family N-acetyltransferase [Spirosoma daeguense]